MPLPGLLIEYLVVGSMALLWVLPLLGIDVSDQIQLGTVATLAPTIYILGMFVDFIAFALLSLLPIKEYSLKHLIRKAVNRDVNEENHSISKNLFYENEKRNSAAHIWLSLESPDLLKEVKERSSRDRIARGAFINILILWLLSATVNTPILIQFTYIQWLITSLFSLLVWVTLEQNSYKFELRVGHELLTRKIDTSS